VTGMIADWAGPEWSLAYGSLLSLAILAIVVYFLKTTSPNSKPLVL
jgi:hypothetical protein